MNNTTSNVPGRTDLVSLGPAVARAFRSESIKTVIRVFSRNEETRGALLTALFKDPEWWMGQLLVGVSAASVLGLAVRGGPSIEATHVIVGYASALLAHTGAAMSQVVLVEHARAIDASMPAEAPSEPDAGLPNV